MPSANFRPHLHHSRAFDEVVQVNEEGSQSHFELDKANIVAEGAALFPLQP
jgi:hypothetical protein